MGNVKAKVVKPGEDEAFGALLQTFPQLTREDAIVVLRLAERLNQARGGG